MVNVMFVPCGTGVAPGGEMLPLGPAEAVIVQVLSSPTAKSLNEPSPVAWMLVAVMAPVLAVIQFGASYLTTAKFVGSAPESTSAATKLSVMSYVVNTTPEFVMVQ